MYHQILIKNIYILYLEIKYSIIIFYSIMNFLISPKGECKIPKKQGSLYCLDIARNSGPFLPKDIMPNNPKSIGLLVGSEIVKSHLIMVRSLQDSQNKIKKTEQSVKVSVKNFQPNNLTSAENLFDFSDYLEGELHHIKKNTEILYLQQKKFKMELEQLQHKINSKNAQNTSEISPLLKDLYSKVKQRFNEQKNEAYKLTRQIEIINHDKAMILQQILLCQNKIQNLQKLVGINHVQYDQIQSSDQQNHEYS